MCAFQFPAKAPSHETVQGDRNRSTRAVGTSDLQIPIRIGGSCVPAIACCCGLGMRRLAGSGAAIHSVGVQSLSLCIQKSKVCTDARKTKSGVATNESVPETSVTLPPTATAYVLYWCGTLAQCQRDSRLRSLPTIALQPKRNESSLAMKDNECESTRNGGDDVMSLSMCGIQSGRRCGRL